MARDLFWVKKCRPGAPPASRRSHSSTAISTPTRRTDAGSSATLRSRGDDRRRQVSPRQRGEPLDLADNGHGHDAGNDRQLAAQRPDAVDQPEVGVRVEEELGDREVGPGLLLLGEDAGIQVEVETLRMTVGERADADAENLRRPSPAGPARWRGSRPSGCRCHGADGPPGGSPRTARTWLTPASAYAPIAPSSSAMDWLTQGEVPHRDGTRPGTDQPGGLDRPGAGRAVGAVGDGYEVRRQSVQPGDRVQQLVGAGCVLRREELETTSSGGARRASSAAIVGSGTGQG